MVFRSSSVRAPGLREEGGGGPGDGDGSHGSALDIGDGGGDVDRHARTAENPRSVEKMRLLGRRLRRGIAILVSISRGYRVSVRFYSSMRSKIIAASFGGRNAPARLCGGAETRNRGIEASRCGTEKCRAPLDPPSGMIKSDFGFTAFDHAHAVVLPPCSGRSAGPFLGARVASRTRRRTQLPAPRVHRIDTRSRIGRTLCWTRMTRG
jgi:hypothetical protein